MLPALPPAFTVPPILMYHRVDVDRPRTAVGRELTITPRQLEVQLVTLRDHGLRAISMAELDRRLREREPVANVVVLTFDDGYLDQFLYAEPLLRKYGDSATFYIITGQVGKPNHVSWPELRTMRADGMDVAAHGVDHDDLSQMTAREQAYQVRTSVAKIRAFVGSPVTTYAYPSGRFDARTLTVVAQAGLSLAVTTDPGYVLPPETRFEMWRVRVRAEWDAAAFWEAVRAAETSPHQVRR